MFHIVTQKFRLQRILSTDIDYLLLKMPHLKNPPLQSMKTSHKCEGRKPVKI